MLRSAHEPPTADAVALLPAVGALLGLAAGGAASLAIRLAPSFGPAIAFGSLVGLTGAIHLDGFLDTCDAAFASVEPDRRLAILDDPRHGSYALAGLAELLAAWYAALAACPPRRRVMGLAFACSTARLAAVWNAAAAPGTSHALRDRLPRGWLEVQTLVVTLGAAAIDVRLTLAVPAAIAMSLATGAWLRGRYGGALPGDGYGFTIAALEPLLLSCVALARTGPVDLS